jgi:hypothetical protein
VTFECIDLLPIPFSCNGGVKALYLEKYSYVGMSLGACFWNGGYLLNVLFLILDAINSIKTSAHCRRLLPVLQVYFGI